MKPTRTRLVGLVAALSTIAIAAPVSTAAADATAAAPVTIVSAGPDSSPAQTLQTPDQAGTVTGPTFITDGSATFSDMLIVVSSGDASSVR
jgi:hypothetical protein